MPLVIPDCPARLPQEFRIRMVQMVEDWLSQHWRPSDGKRTVENVQKALSDPGRRFPGPTGDDAGSVAISFDDPEQLPGNADMQRVFLVLSKTRREAIIRDALKPTPDLSRVQYVPAWNGNSNLSETAELSGGRSPLTPESILDGAGAHGRSTFALLYPPSERDGAIPEQIVTTLITKVFHDHGRFVLPELRFHSHLDRLDLCAIDDPVLWLFEAKLIEKTPLADLRAFCDDVCTRRLGDPLWRQAIWQRLNPKLAMKTVRCAGVALVRGSASSHVLDFANKLASAPGPIKDCKDWKGERRPELGGWTMHQPAYVCTHCYSDGPDSEVWLMMVTRDFPPTQVSQAEQ